MIKVVSTLIQRYVCWDTEHLTPDVCSSMYCAQGRQAHIGGEASLALFLKIEKVPDFRKKIL